MPYSVRMAVEGASVSRGPRPAWLERASDIRFVGYSSEGDKTLLCLSAPSLGEAAEILYTQQTLWDTKPAPEQTAIDVFTKVVHEVGSANPESDWFDRSLLRRFARLDRLFSNQLRALHLPTVRTGDEQLEAAIDALVVGTAQKLSRVTPQGRQVRVTGILDMIRHSTRTFGLRLDNGNEVHGVVESYDLMASLAQHFSKRVLVLGKAVYRPSGSLLRIDATAVEAGERQPRVFARIPPPRSLRPEPVRAKPIEPRERGVAAFFGTWPGDETDADLEAMLREVRG